MSSLFKTFVMAGLVLLSCTCWCKETTNFEVKSDSLHQLQELRNQNVKRLKDIDQALNKKIEDDRSLNLVNEVEILKAEKHEHILRQEFLDRLIFQVDTKFAGGDLRAFLEKALVDMAKIDATSSVTSADGLWKFLKYSAEAIRRLPEQKENILAFLEGYMNRSVSNPTSPEEYLASRNYTNGAKSESGHPLNRDEVGAIADRTLQSPNMQANPPVLQQTR